MLNKEDILALAWEHSEASGKRYTFTEESLFEFLKELKKEPAPTQDECAASHSLPAAGSAVEEVEVVGWLGGNGLHAGENMASGAPFPLMTVAQHERIVVSLTRPAQTAPQPEKSGCPMQPIEFDARGTIRFRENKIIRHLLDFATPLGCGLNELARMDFSQEDRMQLAQLIGYSVSGYGDLSYASDESVEVADRIAATLLAEQTIKS